MLLRWFFFVLCLFDGLFAHGLHGFLFRCLHSTRLDDGVLEQVRAVFFCSLCSALKLTLSLCVSVSPLSLSLSLSLSLFLSLSLTLGSRHQ